MFKLISASRQVFRVSLREREKGRGLASSQPAPPHFLFRCLLDDEPQHGSRVTVAHHQQGGVTAGHPQQHSHLLPLQCLETKEGWWWDQHSKSGGRSAPVGRSLLEVLYLGGVVSLALHLFHDRNNIDWCVLNRVLFGGEQVGRPLSSAYCPVVNIKQSRTVLAQPKAISENEILEDGRLFCEEEAVLLLQQTSLLEQRTQQHKSKQHNHTPTFVEQDEYFVEAKSKRHNNEEQSILCREWIGDQDTSDYSSQSSIGDGEVFPFGLTLEEKALLKLEEEVVPLELEAAGAITAVKMGEGISRLEEVARRGSATGQFYLGMAYQHGLAIGGLAVDPQPKKAMRLYRAAAAQHHHEAEYNLAVMLLESNPESEEAHMLLQTAAKEGVKEAQEVLAWESCKKEECEDPSEQPRDLFGENGDDILGSVEDGGEQLYQWGRQWEREAAKTRGDEWVQALPLFEKAASVGHKRASARFKKLSKRWREPQL